jgi:hypothetical protein
MADKDKFPQDIEESAKKEGTKILGDKSTVADKWTRGDSAYVKVQSSDGSQVVIEYDLKTRRMITYSKVPRELLPRKSSIDYYQL